MKCGMTITIFYVPCNQWLLIVFRRGQDVYNVWSHSMYQPVHCLDIVQDLGSAFYHKTYLQEKQHRYYISSWNRHPLIRMLWPMRTRTKWQADSDKREFSIIVQDIWILNGCFGCNLRSFYTSFFIKQDFCLNCWCSN